MRSTYSITCYSTPTLWRHHHWSDTRPTALASQHEVAPEVWALCLLLAGDPEPVGELTRRTDPSTAQAVVRALRDIAAAALKDGAPEHATGDAVLDLDTIERDWLHLCGPCDAGTLDRCTCPPGDHREVIRRLVVRVRQLEAVADKLALAQRAEVSP